MHCVMALQPINPVEDPRIDHKFHRLRDGITYHYLYGEPQGGRSKATVFLVSTSLHPIR